MFDMISHIFPLYHHFVGCIVIIPLYLICSHIISHSNPMSIVGIYNPINYIIYIHHIFYKLRGSPIFFGIHSHIYIPIRNIFSQSHWNLHSGDARSASWGGPSTKLRRCWEVMGSWPRKRKLTWWVSVEKWWFFINVHHLVSSDETIQALRSLKSVACLDSQAWRAYDEIPKTEATRGQVKTCCA